MDAEPLPGRTNVQLFFNTGDTSPFCRTVASFYRENGHFFHLVVQFLGYHYAVQAKIAKSHFRANGNFAVTIKGDLDSVQTTPLVNYNQFNDGVLQLIIHHQYRDPNLIRLLSSCQSPNNRTANQQVTERFIVLSRTDVGRVEQVTLRWSRPVRLALLMCPWYWTNALHTANVTVHHLTSTSPVVSLIYRRRRQ